MNGSRATQKKSSVHKVDSIFQRSFPDLLSVRRMDATTNRLNFIHSSGANMKRLDQHSKPRSRSNAVYGDFASVLLLGPPYGRGSQVKYAQDSAR
jgi:hypothetical protein